MFLLTSIIKQDNANKMEVNSSLDWIIWKMIESHCLSWLSQSYNITNCLHKVPYFALVLCHHEIQCRHKHFCNKDLLNYHDPQKLLTDISSFTAIPANSTAEFKLNQVCLVSMVTQVNLHLPYGRVRMGSSDHLLDSVSYTSILGKKEFSPSCPLNT